MNPCEKKRTFMLIYVRISETLKGKVDQLVARGHYSDFNAAVNFALENLLVAEEELLATGGANQIVAQTVRTLKKSHRSAPLSQEKQRFVKKADTEVSSKVDGTAPVVIKWAKPPSISDELIVPLPADLFRPGQLVPVERWIFGQQNRVLPAKINARVFLQLLSASGSEIELFEAAAAIADVAADVFRFLNDLDERFGHGKDDLLSTGFPEPGSDKAKSRYANHFAAYENTQGNLAGMLLQWKFTGIKRAKNKTYLLPTRACIEFASLSNPLLDRPVAEKLIQKFSPEEI